MKLFARTKPVSAPERRSGPRVRVDCLATLLMPSGNRFGRVFDISTNGARVVTQDPPAKGVSAILDWNLHEAYCHVIWTKPGMCGVEFDKPVPQRVIDELVEASGAGPRLVHSAPGDEGESKRRPPTRFVG
ncbi:PilZ domain-containing protein [Aurantiacibacter zhengii]|uniref:PilZ domain-containing protein n=1 Tax=Aurantiacibacter zhengii TaxID=2307003 RepID=A0A418NWH4_9SPHN|nr:PilZ domain-containing protein [Aurantiacibacter zhengii]RIV88977.1 PilZ domain-containing protein [Aurantiacibacter zhengii]